MRRGDARGLLDLGLRGAGVAEGDVGRHRVREEEAFLEDGADVAAQVVQVHVPHVDAVDEQPPLGDVVEARRMRPHEDALARARGAEDGDALARLHLEAYVPQDRVQLAVLERDVLESDGALELGPSHGLRRGLFRDVDRGVQDFEDAARPNEGLLHRIDDRRHVVHLAGELLEEPGEDDQARAEGQTALGHQVAAVAEEDGRVDPRHQEPSPSARRG